MSYHELKVRGSEKFPIEIYRIDSRHPEYEMASHWHREVEIISVKSGEFSLRLGESEYPLCGGEVTIVSPDTVHGAIPKDCVYECIVFDAEAFLSVGVDMGGFAESFLRGEVSADGVVFSSDSRCGRIVAALSDAMLLRDEAEKFSVASCLYALFGCMLSEKLCRPCDKDNSPISGKNAAKLKKALNYIRSNYTGSVTLAALSEISGMSPKYFCTFFRRMTRQTPFEYLNSYRIECAAKQLISGNAPVTDIAFGCGFNDLSYFIKVFKRQKGMSPTEYRKKVGPGNAK